MNITIDDTSSNFVWAGDAWRAQAPNQVSINSNYLFQTYHAAQTKGANVTITFIASACQLYGSKGPNHGNYSVTFDNAIKYSPGFSETTQYRQLLFSHVFGEDYDTHTVILRNEEDFWLDLDFMVITVNGTAPSTQDIGFFTSTVSPATAVPANPTSTDSTGSTNSSSSSNNSIFRTLTFALAGVLGVLILLILVWFFVLRKRSQQTGQRGGDANSQEFRYGHKVGPSDTILDASQHGEGKDTNSGKHSSVLGFGRTKVGKSIEDASLMQTPTSASVTAADHSPFSRNSTLANAGVSGAARETLIALNNMGKRPGYRNLAGGESSSSVVVTSHRDQGRETPNSLRTFGSAGQTWLGASKNDPDVRFRGRAREDSITGSGPSSHGSDTSGGHLLSGRVHSRGGSNQTTPKDDDYASGGLGLGIYTPPRNDLDQRRADLRRSASVASSGIIDRMASSPPPAVPELPPLSSAASNLSGRSGLPNRSFSPNPTESMYSQPGALRLQPPPLRSQHEERERERLQRERERSEKEREAAREREERERQQRIQERHSRPPPEYMATPTSSESFIPPVPTQGATLQRNGTRTGNIPIGIEGGFVDDGESQESHSVTHAYVQTALHVNVPPTAPGQVPPLPSTTQFVNQQYSSSGSSLPYAQPPPPRPQHMRDNGSGSASASGSQSLNPIHPTTKQAITPDNSRSYTPDRTMAIPRTSEDRVWTLDGPNAAARGVGMPIMDDRTRLAAGGIGGTPRRVSRIPPPAQ